MPPDIGMSPSAKADIARIENKIDALAARLEGRVDALAAQMKLLTVLTAGVCIAMALFVVLVVAGGL